MDNLPDNYIEPDIYGDVEWDYACEAFNTQTPTDEQLLQACIELSSVSTEWEAEIL